MGIRHRVWPVHGVQFHPESFLTEHGLELVGRFLGLQPRFAGIVLPSPCAAEDRFPRFSEGCLPLGASGLLEASL
jgi:anthranilate synthase component 2